MPILRGALNPAAHSCISITLINVLQIYLLVNSVHVLVRLSIYGHTFNLFSLRTSS